MSLLPWKSIIDTILAWLQLFDQSQLIRRILTVTGPIIVIPIAIRTNACFLCCTPRHANVNGRLLLVTMPFGGDCNLLLWMMLRFLQVRHAQFSHLAQNFVSLCRCIRICCRGLTLVEKVDDVERDVELRGEVEESALRHLSEPILMLNVEHDIMDLFLIFC